MHQWLQGVPIFAGLKENTLAWLMGRAQLTDVAAGMVVVKEGETGNRLFLIRDGMVRVVKHYRSAEEVELSRLGPREFFGEMCILETLRRSASVIALANSSLCSLSSMDFYQFYQEQPAQYSILLLNIARDLSRRLRRLDEAFAARH